MRLIDIVRRALAGLDDRARAAFEAPEETTARRAGMPTYSRFNPNPAWGGRLPGPGERVVGRQIVADGPRPPGETILGAAAAMDFGREFAPEPSTSDGIGPDFFAARQALADRKR